MSKYAINKDFWLLKFVLFNIKSRVLTALFNVYSTLTFIFTFNSKIETRRFKCAEYATGKKKIRCELYRPKALAGKKIPCIMYAHGGGFAIKGAGHHKVLMHMYALQANCAVAYVEYSLIPKRGYPHAFSEYKDMIQTAINSFGDIDETKIVLAGDSAGGCLAAAVAQYSANMPKRNLANATIVGQMLVYPVLDYTMQTESNRKYIDTPVWNSNLSEAMWTWLLLGTAYEDMCGYVSPAKGKIDRYLPRAYIETTEFDCLHDEGENYANALREVHVDVTYHSPKGTVHAYDLVKSSAITKDSIQRRVEFLKSVFSAK